MFSLSPCMFGKTSKALERQSRVVGYIGMDAQKRCHWRARNTGPNEHQLAKGEILFLGRLGTRVMIDWSWGMGVGSAGAWGQWDGKIKKQSWLWGGVGWGNFLAACASLGQQRVLIPIQSQQLRVYDKLWRFRHIFCPFCCTRPLALLYQKGGS